MATAWKKILVEGDGRRGIGAAYDSGEGNTVALGERVFVTVPYGATITSYSISALTGESGSIEIDIWKTNGSVPDIGDSILTSSLELDGSEFKYSTDLSEFTTTTITEGDCICFYVVNNSDLRGFEISLSVTKD